MSSPPPVSLSLPAANPKKRPSQLSGAPNSSHQPKRPRVQHPLAQTSFPSFAEANPRVYSGSVGGNARSEIDGVSVTGSFTGSLAGSFVGSIDGKARGKKRGRKDREGTASVKGVATETGSVTRSLRSGEGVDDEEDDDDLGDAELVGGDDAAPDAVAEKENLAILIDAFTPEQSERYDLFKRTKLNKPTLRKIVNQTLSQSVPPAVITTVSGFTKVFIGEMIEKARTVQSEWAEVADSLAFEAVEKEERREAERRAEKAREQAERAEEAARHAALDAVGEAGRRDIAILRTEMDVADAARIAQAQNSASKANENDSVAHAEKPGEEKQEKDEIKPESASREQVLQSIPSHTSQQRQEEVQRPLQTQQQGSQQRHSSQQESQQQLQHAQQQQQQQQPPQSTQLTIPDSPTPSSPKRRRRSPGNPHRGPLLPSHLREALRRYKRAAEGGNVGFSGLSLNGYGVKGSFVWTVRGGGRRLFR
ncbi:hypothetical protein VTO42DRAFT_6756 [Malbranchea cinnamomea]